MKAKSEYLKDWERYARDNDMTYSEAEYMLPHVEATEDSMFRFIMNLIM